MSVAAVDFSRIPLRGDFYFEDGDVVRGISLPFKAVGDAVEFNDVFDAGKLGKSSFKDTDVAPALTEEMTSCLAKTQLLLSGYSAVTVGNSMLKFLSEAVSSCIRKINPKKFTIRTGVVLDGYFCEIKICIYQEGPSILVEFQRQSGDVVAFMKFYHQASAYLLGTSHSEPRVDARKLPEIPCTADLPPGQAIAPLLDIANSSQDVKLLSEVASVLATMSKDSQLAAHLRMPCDFSVLQHLRQVDDLSAQMLSCI